MRLADLGRVLRGGFAAEAAARGADQAAVEELLTCLRHHRAGQRETEGFLRFYADSKVGRKTCNTWSCYLQPEII